MESVVLGILLGLVSGGLVGACYVIKVAYQDLRGVRERYLKQYLEIQAERDANRERETRLYRELSGNRSEVIEAVTTGIAMCLNGLPAEQGLSEQERVSKEQQTEDWGFDDDGPRDRMGNRLKDEGPQWIPEIEMDAEMVSALGERQTVVEPAMGGWVASTPQPGREGEEPGYEIRNGGPRRRDGQAMFRPGTSAKPPMPGLED